MFSLTNKTVTDVWNSEVDSIKKISIMADFQGTASWCITTRVRIRHVMIPLVLPHRIPLYFLDLSMQFKHNTCNIQFIKSFHLKYGIYKQAHSFLYRIYHLPRFINSIFQMERLINSIHFITSSEFNAYQMWVKLVFFYSEKINIVFFHY